MDQHDEERDEEHDDEHEEEEDGDEEESAPEPVPPPRRAVRRTVASANPARPLSPFGAIPENVTHWSVRKRSAAGRFEVCEAPSSDGSIMLREWPLAELSAERIRDRFGPGDYTLQWIGTSPRGGRAAVGKSRSFGIPAAPPAPAPAPAAPPAQGLMLPPEFQQTFALMSMFEQMQANKLAQLGQMAAMLGGQSRGPDSTVLEMMRDMMREQREASERQTQLILRALQADDDDEEEPAAARSIVPAGAPAPVFKPGEPISESIKATALNWAASNPDQAAALAKQVLDTVGKIAGAVAGPAPRARAASTPVRRGPAILVEQRPSEPEPHANGVAPAGTNEPYASAARAQAPAASSS